MLGLMVKKTFMLTVEDLVIFIKRQAQSNFNTFIHICNKNKNFDHFETPFMFTQAIFLCDSVWKILELTMSFKMYNLN